MGLDLAVPDRPAGETVTSVGENGSVNASPASYASTNEAGQIIVKGESFDELTEALLYGKAPVPDDSAEPEPKK